MFIGPRGSRRRTLDRTELQFRRAGNTPRRMGLIDQNHEKTLEMKACLGSCMAVPPAREDDV